MGILGCEDISFKVGDVCGNLICHISSWNIGVKRKEQIMTIIEEFKSHNVFPSIIKGLDNIFSEKCPDLGFDTFQWAQTTEYDPAWCKITSTIRNKNRSKFLGRIIIEFNIQQDILIGLLRGAGWKI